MNQKITQSPKATCLTNIFSIFLPKTTTRVLSDKKIQKSKKIDLTLLQHQKSKSQKKLTVLQSLHNKQPQITTIKSSYNIKNLSTNFKYPSINTNKGLNFHPRKISFNQHPQNYKIKKTTQIPINTIINTPTQTNINTHSIFNNYSYQKSQIIHQLQHKKQPALQQFKLNYHHDHQLEYQLHSPLKNKNRFHCKQLSKINEQAQNTGKQLQTNNNQIANKQKQQTLPPTYPTSQKQQQQSNIQSIGTLKNQSFDQNPKFISTQTPSQAQNPFTQISLHTPNLIKKSHSQFHPIPQQPQQKITKKLSNLFQGSTIKSKYQDTSSQKQPSIIYSNVIQRFNVQQCQFNPYFLKFHHIKKQQSLNTNLFRKFDHQTQVFRKTDYQCYTNQKLYQQQEYQQIFLHPNKYQKQQIKQQQNQYLFLKLSSTNHNNSNQPIKNKSLYNKFIKLTYLNISQYSNIYLCMIKQLNFLFMIKQINKTNPSSSHKFITEINQSTSIQYYSNHPYITNLYHVWQDHEKLYLALQYGQQTLLTIIQQKSSIPQDISICYIYQILKGLNYLHQRGIIHRDIKPQNIILCNSVCKIGDFRFATQISSINVNQPCGTPCYQSPQLSTHQPYTHKSDCWSLGVLAYQLITGKLQQHLFTNEILNRDNLKYPNNISQQYQTLVYFLLAPHEEERPSSDELLRWEIFKSIQ